MKIFPSKDPFGVSSALVCSGKALGQSNTKGSLIDAGWLIHIWRRREERGEIFAPKRHLFSRDGSRAKFEGGEGQENLIGKTLKEGRDSWLLPSNFSDA